MKVNLYRVYAQISNKTSGHNRYYIRTNFNPKSRDGRLCSGSSHDGEMILENRKTHEPTDFTDSLALMKLNNRQTPSGVWFVLESD